MKTLARPQKILAVMFDLSQGEPKALQYEEIVVAAFKRYPEEFQLRGYPEYPDSSDIHKPLYKMKKEGLVRAANKSFELTPRGLEFARGLSHTDSSDRSRLTKPEEQEIKRVVSSEACRLFNEGRGESILDTDFYDYLGVTVRTGKGDFMGRLRNVEHAIEAHGTKRKDVLSEKLKELHVFLTKRFKEEIDARR